MLIRIHYLDASALIKLLVDEVGSPVIRNYVGNNSVFLTTSLCFAEALGALKVKRFYRKELTDEQYLAACDELLAYVSHETIKVEDVEISDKSIFAKVEEIVRKYNIDLSDAFQIVSIKQNYYSRFTNDSNPILITGDVALAKTARQEKIRVWDCINESEPTPESQ